MKKGFALLLSLALMVTLLAGCGGAPSSSSSDTSTSSSSSSSSDASLPEDSSSRSESSSDVADKTPVNVVALKGPTAIGMVGLMDAQDQGAAANDYSFTLAAAPDDIVGLVTTGAVDIAAVPANLASVLYQKTEGAVNMLAVNTLGVLYIVERGDTVQSIADLAGKTVYATGQGSTPEYALHYILEKNGLDDVTVEYRTEHAELATLLASGEIDLALLPQPFVTTVLQKDDSLRVALDLTEEWNAASEGESDLVMGGLIVRKEFAQAHPEAVEAFLREYADSVAFVNDEVAAAAALCERYDIIPAAVAEQAIPDCNIVCLTGDDMRASVEKFFEVLYNADPASVGGALPDEAFYYVGAAE